MLSPADREIYDDARILYHSELQVVRTSAVREIAHQGRLLTLLNQRETGARRGLIVSGQQTTGKTTALKQLGRLHELRVRQRCPDSDEIPVVYLTAPPKGSPRKLAIEFARFLGLPSVSARHNTIDITNVVCQVMIEARTDLVLVDEIHLLNHGTAAGEDLSDHLKYFTEHLPATFVYAGIDVEQSGVFTGIRGRQMGGRCTLVRTGPFPRNAEWRSLIATLENTLRLHRHQPQTLVNLSDYLHRRTDGMIGSLSHLIRAAVEIWDPRRYIAIYPEVVAATALYASPDGGASHSPEAADTSSSGPSSSGACRRNRSSAKAASRGSSKS